MYIVTLITQILVGVLSTTSPTWTHRVPSLFQPSVTEPLTLNYTTHEHNSPTLKDGTYHARDFLRALRLKESQGELREDGVDVAGLGALGDFRTVGGKRKAMALGPYQIWEVFFKDAKEYDRTLGHNYRKVLTSHKYSEEVINAYYSRWEPAAWKRMKAGKGTDDDINTLTRLHNGGPSWAIKTGEKLDNLNEYHSEFRKIWDSTDRTPYTPDDPYYTQVGARKRQTGLPDSITKGGDPNANFYTVQKDDSLWKISKKLWGKGSRHTEISNANGLTSDRIVPGQRLFIPADGVPGKVDLENVDRTDLVRSSTYTMDIGTKASASSPQPMDVSDGVKQEK